MNMMLSHSQLKLDFELEASSYFYEANPSDPGPGPGPEPTDPTIPEPATMLLFGSGLLGLAGLRKKTRIVPYK